MKALMRTNGHLIYYKAGRSGHDSMFNCSRCGVKSMSLQNLRIAPCLQARRKCQRGPNRDARAALPRAEA
jgi:hypothetical protein